MRFRCGLDAAGTKLLGFGTMTHQTWILSDLDEPAVGRFAERLGLWLRRGDVLALSGELGAGKTTFARALIRSLLANDEAEVPSPTFALVQTYDGPRGHVAHFDLYRLGDASETAEIGLDDAAEDAISIVEWPERVNVLPGAAHLSIRFIETPISDVRTLTLSADLAFAPRLARCLAANAFIKRVGWDDARATFLQGDASARRYTRLSRAGGSAILMDAPRQPDGPIVQDGKPYSRIAHLAEDVGPFVAVDRTLRAAGLSAPTILAEDLDAGFLLIEDMGDRVYGTETDGGSHQSDLWTAAIDMLLALRRANPPMTMQVSPTRLHQLPQLDATILSIEVALLPDWYWPEIYGTIMPSVVRAHYEAVWQPVIAHILTQPTGWLLRDVHSPNLLWLPEREAAQRVGVIDFQDALAGPWAHDVMSLLQDARVDVPEALETKLLARYAAHAATLPGFNEQDFRLTYAAYGALRATRLLGLFVRLLRRDDKPHYLAHIPRNWRYLERNLRHPALAPLADWYDTHLPVTVRNRAIVVCDSTNDRCQPRA